MLILIGIILGITVIGLIRQSYLNITFNRRVARRIRGLRGTR